MRGSCGLGSDRVVRVSRCMLRGGTFVERLVTRNFSALVVGKGAAKGNGTFSLGTCTGLGSCFVD